jgi:ribosome-associated toxin RatA of RatAB toxin-antitoxin module
MANRTTSTIRIRADPSAIMGVIADFSSYPQWARGVQSTQVLDVGPDGRPREVAFRLDAAPIRDDYTLRYTWKDDRSVTWSLVEAKMLKSMEGSYQLRPAGNETDVSYELAVDLAIPMIGMLKRKGEKVIIDTALRGLKDRVETSGGMP